ncbi:Hypothetical predicted protein [Lecanosticta acicola]|uniref:Uncharacterized protein n=1 Tax=Lecanosticta acicola TaxID=111012 RepID=A0AAI8YSN5_9PEZI|nr:Hypothetical predicted protein [Lecanosticta acicola]
MSNPANGGSNGSKGPSPKKNRDENTTLDAARQASLLPNTNSNTTRPTHGSSTGQAGGSNTNTEGTASPPREESTRTENDTSPSGAPPPTTAPTSTEAEKSVSAADQSNRKKGKGKAVKQEKPDSIEDQRSGLYYSSPTQNLADDIQNMPADRQPRDIDAVRQSVDRRLVRPHTPHRTIPDCDVAEDEEIKDGVAHADVGPEMKELKRQKKQLERLTKQTQETLAKLKNEMFEAECLKERITETYEDSILPRVRDVESVCQRMKSEAPWNYDMNAFKKSVKSQLKQGFQEPNIQALVRDMLKRFESDQRQLLKESQNVNSQQAASLEEARKINFQLAASLQEAQRINSQQAASLKKATTDLAAMRSAFSKLETDLKDTDKKVDAYGLWRMYGDTQAFVNLMTWQHDLFEKGLRPGPGTPWARWTSETYQRQVAIMKADLSELEELIGLEDPDQQHTIRFEERLEAARAAAEEKERREAADASTDTVAPDEGTPAPGPADQLQTAGNGSATQAPAGRGLGGTARGGHQAGPARGGQQAGPARGGHQAATARGGQHTNTSRGGGPPPSGSRGSPRGNGPPVSAPRGPSRGGGATLWGGRTQFFPPRGGAPR